MVVSNADLRLSIARLVQETGEGHIPSSYSIVDILDVLYGQVLDFRVDEPRYEDRDFFILSKGHGAAALFAVMHKYGLVSSSELAHYGRLGGILGGHPDATKVPHVEASTGSLGHGFPSAVGIALGLKILGRSNRVFALLGDGECHEGTIWESAHVAANLGLDSLTAIVDWNQSASQLMPIDDLPAKWQAFGWKVSEVDGHDSTAIRESMVAGGTDGKPHAVIAHTTKGKGVSFMEGHGVWHHRIPDDSEMKRIQSELKH